MAVAHTAVHVTLHAIQQQAMYVVPVFNQRKFNTAEKGLCVCHEDMLVGVCV